MSMAMRTVLTKLILTATIIVSGTAVLVASEAGAFLENPIGARATAMGQAQVAVVNDGSAAYWNPSALTQLRYLNLSSMMTNVFGVVDHRFLSYSQPMPLGVGGIALISTGVSGIEGGAYVNGVSTLTGASYSYASSAWLFSYALTMTELNRFFHQEWLGGLADHLNLGATMKLISESLATSNASGYSLDLGMQYKIDSKTQAGLTLRNILASTLQWQGGNGTDASSLPMEIVMGLGYFADPRLQTSLDFNYRSSRGLRYGVGGEYLLMGNDGLLVTDPLGLKLRGGFNNGMISLGFGLRYKELDCDYSYTAAPADSMDTTHRFSLSYRIDSMAQRSQAPMEVPIPQTTVAIPTLEISLTSNVPINETVTTESEIPKTPEIQKVPTPAPAVMIKPKTIAPVIPRITLDLPDAPVTTTNSQIMIRGKVIAAKKLLVNGKELWVNPNGYFFTKLPLEKGENLLIFKAFSRTGHVVKITRHVIISP